MNFLKFFHTLVVGGVVVALAASAISADDWTLPRANPQLTNATNEEIIPPLALSWVHQTKQYAGNSSQPVVIGNMVVFAVGDRVIGLETATGSRKWMYPAEQPMGSLIRTSLAAYQDHVYFGANDGSLYCISSVDGRYLWAYATQAPVRSSPNIVDGRIYVGSDDNALHVIDAEVGTPLWPGGFITRDDVTSSAAVDGGLAYFLSRDTHLYVANAQTGRLRWATRLAVPTLNIVPVIANDTIYLGAGNLLHAMMAKSGNRKWVLTLPAEVSASPAFANQTLFVPLRNHKMYAITSTGKTKWAQPVDTLYTARCSPTVAGNTVIVGADKGVISAFDIETGLLKWRYVVPGYQATDGRSISNNIVASPVWANGALYVLPDDGGLRCFRADAPDNTPPDVYSLTPSPGISVSGSPPLKISSIISDEGSGVDDSSIVLSLDGDAVEHVYDPASGAVSYATPYSATQTALQDGRHTLVLIAKDWKGNEVKANWSFVVDNTMPKPRVRPAKAPEKRQPRDRGNRGEPENSSPPAPTIPNWRDRNRGDGGEGGVPPPPPPPPMPGPPGGEAPAF